MLIKSATGCALYNYKYNENFAVNRDHVKPFTCVWYLNFLTGPLFYINGPAQVDPTLY